MADIVHRLRTQPPIYGPKSDTQLLREEAATEIERLRAALTEISEGDVKYLATPTGAPEPGYPGWWGHLAAMTLAANTSAHTPDKGA